MKERVSFNAFKVSKNDISRTNKKNAVITIGIEMHGSTDKKLSIELTCVVCERS